MSKQFDKLIVLLKELFQLDQPDLDFGLYRIMHAKSDEITQFLERDLLPQVKEAFSHYTTADKTELEKELKKSIDQANGLGVDPESTEKVKELRQKLANESVDVAGLEAEVYDHLYSFFRRYYHEGDFLAKRVYKPGVYAIPYEGEEVKLHWANQDQYYIKSSEYLRDYAFMLHPDNEADPMRVHFRLADAKEGEHGNVKAAEGKERVFILKAEDFIGEEDGELVIAFEYRPSTLDDWSEEGLQSATAAAKKKPPVQKVLLEDAVRRVLSYDDPALKRWIDALSKKHVKVNGETADYSRLEGHLNRYSARHTFDYFIHKDLGGFLRRELDFYIKNEVMHLDDVENETAPKVEQYLSKIKVVRKIAHKLIDFLAQLEDFQKKLWLKKKFVVETNYCITLDRIPEEFYPEIAANEAQREEWVRLFAIDDLDGYQKPLPKKFLKDNPFLVLDTAYFSNKFKDSLIARIENINQVFDGVLVHSENFQAISLLSKYLQKMVECIYIDPPYNTGDSEILYKNEYMSSSWLTLMENRISKAINLLTDDPVIFIAIDDFEMVDLCEVIDTQFPELRREMIIVNHHPQGGKAKVLANTHEYMLTCVSKSSDRTLTGRFSQDGIEHRPFKRSGTAESNYRYGRPNSFYALLVEPETKKVVGLEAPPSEESEYPRENTEEGFIRVYPLGSQGKERVWRRSYESCRNLVEENKLISTDTFTIYQIIEVEDRVPALFSNWVDPRYNAGTYGANLLRDMIGEQNPFSYPKSIKTVEDAIYSARLEKNAFCLDFFAGSGTTGHAVINLNREDKQNRKYILVEMGDYFDSVLTIRIKKAAYSTKWKEGKPVDRDGISQGFKYIRLESYEGAINNLEICRDGSQKSLLDKPESGAEGGLKEQYLLQYMLNTETQGSPSLLNISAFQDPTAYKLKIKRPGSDESREVNVDLLETFNYLIGLTVQHIEAPQTLQAKFKRDEEKRLLLDDRLKQDDTGPWWFRTVTGKLPDGRNALVIWRKLTGKPEQDNLVLDEWFTAQGYSTKDYEFDLIYVNGDSNLENLRQPDDTWKVRVIEEDFHRLMFENA